MQNDIQNMYVFQKNIIKYRRALWTEIGRLVLQNAWYHYKITVLKR